MRRQDARGLQAAITGEQHRAAVDQVDQARWGDQNAMGMIEEVRKAAEAGSPRAVASYQAMMQYAQQNPPDEALIGAETAVALGTLKDPTIDPDGILRVLCALPACPDRDAIDGAVCILSFGPPLNTARIAELGASVPPPYTQVFSHGLANANDSRVLDKARQGLDAAGEGYLCAGHCLGVARRIQRVRAGQGSVGMLGPEIGWEVGC